jgi:hypothetical protein
MVNHDGLERSSKEIFQVVLSPYFRDCKSCFESELGWHFFVMTRILVPESDISLQKKYAYWNLLR